MSGIENPRSFRGEALEARLGLQLASRLSEGVDRLPHDVTERLRHARNSALSHRLAAQPTIVGAHRVGAFSAATLSFGGGPSSGKSWWTSLGVLVPVAVLAGGLYLISHFHAQQQIAAAAEIDAALLSDDLPPAAYSDPGFVEFLKTARD